jgi:hypothetical protein
MHFLFRCLNDAIHSQIVLPILSTSVSVYCGGQITFDVFTSVASLRADSRHKIDMDILVATAKAEGHYCRFARTQDWHNVPMVSALPDS